MFYNTFHRYIVDLAPTGAGVRRAFMRLHAVLTPIVPVILANIEMPDFGWMAGALGWRTLVPAAALSAALPVSALIYGRCVRTVSFPHWLAMRVAALFTSPDRSGGELRTRFQELELKISAFHGHSHPLDAARRRAVDRAIGELVLATGYREYSVAMSGCDQTRGLDGSADYYGIKDFTRQLQMSPLLPHHVIKMVDVDYYIADLAKYFAGNHACIYTINPKKPGDSNCDHAYSITDDVLTYHVNGGELYKHRLWNWNRSYVCFPRWTSSSYYLVDRMTIPDSNDRELVLLTHMMTLRWPLSWLLSFLMRLDGAILRRRTFKSCRGESVFNVTRELFVDGHTKPRTLIHICPEGFSCSATYSEAEFFSCWERFRTSKTEARATDAEMLIARIRNVKGTDLAFEASVFHDFYSHGHAYPFRPLVTRGRLSTAPRDAVRRYVFPGPSSGPARWPAIRSLAGPVIADAAWVPARSVNNTIACLAGRVALVRNKVTQQSIPSFYRVAVAEFVAHIACGLYHTLCPLDAEQIESKMRTPAQRARLHLQQVFLGWTPTKCKVRQFQKNEIYEAPKDPRAISPTNLSHRYIFAAFMYPLMGVLKRCLWYGFNTPAAVAERVHQLASRATFAFCGDLSRFDGHHSQFDTFLELSLYLALYPPRDHSVIRKLFENEGMAMCATDFGLMYAAKFCRLSGSMNTSVGNTICDAFYAFAAYAVSGLSWDEAYDSLGIYAGDDSLSFDLPVDSYRKVIMDVGHQSTYEVVGVDEPITFLARIYPCACSSPEYMPDIRRRLCRAGFSTAPVVVPNSEVAHRMQIACDAEYFNTPILSEYITMLVRAYPVHHAPGKYDKYLDNLPYWSKFDHGLIAPYQVQLEVAARQLQLTTSELRDYVLVIRNHDLNKPSELPPLTQQAYQVKRQVVVDGHIVGNPDPDYKHAEDGLWSAFTSRVPAGAESIRGPLLIYGFPGTGKTYAATKLRQMGIATFDTDAIVFDAAGRRKLRDTDPTDLAKICDAVLSHLQGQRVVFTNLKLPARFNFSRRFVYTKEFYQKRLEEKRVKPNWKMPQDDVMPLKIGQSVWSELVRDPPSVLNPPFISDGEQSAARPSQVRKRADVPKPEVKSSGRDDAKSQVKKKRPRARSTRWRRA